MAQASSTASAPRAKRTRCTASGCRKLAPPGRKRCNDHKPGAALAQNKAPVLCGFTEPRLYTPPLRPLTRATSLGYEVIDFMRAIGDPFLPWQEFAVIHALELDRNGHLRFRTVLIKVARQNGKSKLKRGVTLWRLYKYPRYRVLGIAQDVSLAREQWSLCQESIHSDPDLAAEFDKPRNVNGDEMFWLLNGSRYAIKAANRKAGRGGSNDEVNIDELREQTDWKAWGAVASTTTARPDGQVWAMTNEGDDTSVVLNRLTDVADAGTDPQLCRLEWSAPPGCELDDTEGWRHANPGLGYIITEAAIRSRLATDPPDVFRTEVLCQRVAALDTAIDAAAWKDCGDDHGTLTHLRDRVCAVLDVAPDGAHAALLVAARTADGRARVEVAAAWRDAAECRAGLEAIVGQIRPAAYGWLSTGPAAELADLNRAIARKYNHRAKRRDGDPPEDGHISGQAVTDACQQFAGLVRGRRVLHPNDPLLTTHATTATKLMTGDGWRFTRKGGHVNAAYAAAGAISMALALPEPRKPRLRWVS